MLEWFRKLAALPPAASTFAEGVDWLHFVVIGTSILGSIGIAAIAALFIARYRERTPGAATPHLVVSFGQELTLITGILGLFLVWWVIGYRQFLKARRPPSDASAVYVTAKQWMWKFTYPDGRSANNVLTVPVGRPVELIMTSRDVIHSLFVPAFRVKQDVLPGRYVTLWFQATRPGEFPIYCAEYCGVSHSNMHARIHILSPADYEAWLGESAAPDESRSNLAEAGKRAALKHECFACHTVDGQRHIGPSWSGLYGSTVSLEGDRTVIADPEYLTRSMMEPEADVVAGFRPVMPTYLGSLPEPEAAAIVHYIRTLRNRPIAPRIALPNLKATEQPRADGGVLERDGSGSEERPVE